MKSVAFYNLGCKVNSYELDVMQQRLSEKGYKIVPFSQKADIYVVNTCTVTNMADRKSRQILHRAKKENPEAIVVAVGCYVQTDKEGALKDECVDLCVGNNKKRDLPEILEAYIKEREKQEENLKSEEKENHPAGPTAEQRADEKTLYGTTIIDIDNTYEYEEAKINATAEHTRAYIKIQDGCNQFCSYCAIPLARGRVRSRKAQDIIEEIENMVKAGYKEVVLTGIHISSYGIDFSEEAWEHRECVENHRTPERLDYSGSSKLIDLIEMIHDILGLERIRIGSLEPRIVTPEAAKRLAALEKICPHFHLSLQSGCDATLKRMNRRYTAAEYKAGVEALREAFENPAITTDVIVGFPGETEEEFEVTKAFLEDIRFYELHVFKYSKRANTKAAVMPNQVPEPTKTERSNELLALDEKLSIEYRKKYLEKIAEVLWEEEKEIKGKNYLLGHTKDYVKIAICLNRDELQKRKASSLQGEICKVSVADFLTEEILLANETDLF